MVTYTLKVVKIIKETEDAYTFCFKQPALRKIKYKGGQYLSLIFRINNRRYIRPYSLSSCPDVDQMLEVTIKRVLNGVVSNHIIDQVNVGDAIEVLAPTGDFIFEPERNPTSVYLWGVGSGITPLMSIAKQILNATEEVNVYLIYGNKTFESTIFAKKIEEMQHQYCEKFKVQYFYSKLENNKNNSNISGRIDKERVLNLLNDNLCLENSAHYICGPAGLKESVKEALCLKNISLEQVFCEDFELVKNPKDFKDIETRTIELNYQGQEFQLEVTKGKSILEVALDANIELPYSCQTGNCSTCKAVLKTGNLKMIGLSKERDDLRENEYLLCCSHPLDNEVSIEI